MHFNQSSGAGVLTRARSVWRDYLSLTKPRIVALLLLTTLTTMLVAGETLPPVDILIWTLLAGALAAGGAGALNCYFERDLDALMLRTRQRPLPAQRLTPRQALYFGLLLSIFSVFLLWSTVNPLTAWLALGGIAYYVFVYTLWLKRRTPHNIVIGGGAGAIAPLVGWAAVTNSLEPMAFLLFAIVFYWTPPHFWALALKIKGDYALAQIPMFPLVYGDQATRRHILSYSIPMVILTLLPIVLEEFDLFYGVVALSLGGTFIYYAVQLCRRHLIRDAERLFHYSLIYLALLFLAMVIDRIPVLLLF